MPTSSRSFRFPLFLAAGVLAVAVPALAQTTQPRSPCRTDDYGDRAVHCEVRDHNLPAVDMLYVDAAPNGGIKVQGWNRREVSLQAKVVATADTDSEAKALASQVRVRTDGGRISAEGPRTFNGSGWSVSYDLMVPAQGGLDLTSRNGGITIAGVEGQIAFRTTNGGIRLTNVNGNVRGTTTNGGVTVTLDGDGWHGEALDVETKNGGVRLTVPDGYSAHLEARTTNGGLRIDFPVTIEGRWRRSLETDLGRGGSPIRLATVNGGVSIERK